MTDADKTVFLSYRRDVSSSTALLVYKDLRAHGFNVFMDVDGINNGVFEHAILHEIQRRAHFVVLLEPRSTDRIADAADWMRREIAHALHHERNVVPVLAKGYRMPDATELPADVAAIVTFNAVTVPDGYFDAAMQRLRDRFLNAARREWGAASSAHRPSQLRPGVLPAPRITGHMAPLASVTWTEVRGCSRYELQQSQTPTFDRAVVLDRVTQTRHRVRRRDLQAGTWFRIRALADEEKGTSAWSAGVEIHAAPRVVDVFLARPTLSVTPYASVVELDWRAGDVGATSTLECAYTRDFTVTRTAYEGADNHYRHNPPRRGPIYYRVRRTTSTGGDGVWSVPAGVQLATA